MAEDFNLTEDEIVELCRRREGLITGQGCRTSPVIRVGNVAIKFSWGLLEQEAINQKIAGQILDPLKVRVPRVFGYFQRDDVGYLSMEYIEGRLLTEEDQVDLAACVNYMHSFTSPSPGPMRYEHEAPPDQGGRKQSISDTLLWSTRDESLTFSCAKDIEAFVHRRLKRSAKPEDFNLEDTPFRLCHMDLASRNILRCPDGRFALLDWAFSGYWPRSFEIAAIRMSGNTYAEDAARFADSLEECIVSTHPLSPEEDSQAWCMCWVQFNCIRYCFDPPQNIDDIIMRFPPLQQPDGQPVELPLASLSDGGLELGGQKLSELVDPWYFDTISSLAA